MLPERSRHEGAAGGNRHGPRDRPHRRRHRHPRRGRRHGARRCMGCLEPLRRL